MRIIALQEAQPKEIVTGLTQGQTLVYPTETCYGLGCDATNGEAVEKLFQIKARETGKPMLVVVGSVAMAKEYLEWSETIEELAKKYWPGALTIVAAAKEGSGLARGIVTPEGTVALRVTTHPCPAELSLRLGKPLVSTSANRAGGDNPYSIEQITASFPNGSVQPDLVIDAGVLSPEPPSTIVSVVGDTLSVIRQGSVHIDVL